MATEFHRMGERAGRFFGLIGPQQAEPADFLAEPFAAGFSCLFGKFFGEIGFCFGCQIFAIPDIIDAVAKRRNIGARPGQRVAKDVAAMHARGQACDPEPFGPFVIFLHVDRLHIDPAHAFFHAGWPRMFQRLAA